MMRNSTFPLKIDKIFQSRSCSTRRVHYYYMFAINKLYNFDGYWGEGEGHFNKTFLIYS